MSEPTEQAPRFPTAAGYCSYCGGWTPEGVVVTIVHSESGPGAVIVRHAEHVGLRKPARADRPRTHSG
jgi:hypothetical protein